MGAPWYDVYLARWLSADTLVPEPGNPQALNRYSYVRNSPLRFVDPTGYFSEDVIKEFLLQTYGDKWWEYWIAWSSDQIFMKMLVLADYGDALFLEGLGQGYFGRAEDSSTFRFVHAGGHALTEYQGQGPLTLVRDGEKILDHPSRIWYHPVEVGDTLMYDSFEQPVYDYSSGVPRWTGTYRIATYTPTGRLKGDAFAGDSMPGWIELIIGFGGTILDIPIGVPVAIAGFATLLNNSIHIEYGLTVSEKDRTCFIGRPPPPPGVLEVVEP
jgi:hypothetical protein